MLSLIWLISIIVTTIFFRPQTKQLNCGLWGMASSSLSAYELERLVPMSYLTSLRGVDSTGAAVVYRDKKEYKSTVIRGLQIPPSFLQTEVVKKSLRSSDKGTPFIVAAHNRFATQGSVSTKNIHPFRCKHIIGMHNGTVNDLVPKKEDKTDSQTIFEMMSSIGFEETILKIKHGAYALVWIDEKEQTLNFYRNAQRPLYFASLPGSILAWMSEKWMLEVLADRVHCSYPQIEALPVNTLWTVPFGSIVPKKRDFYPYATEVEKKSETPFQTSVPSVSTPPVSPPRAGGIVTSALYKGYPYGAIQETSSDTSGKVLVGLKGPFNKVIYTEEFKDEMGECFNCNKKMNPESETVFWIPDNNTKKISDAVPFCQKCVTDGDYRFWGAKESEIVEGEKIYAN